MVVCALGRIDSEHATNSCSAQCCAKSPKLNPRRASTRLIGAWSRSTSAHALLAPERLGANLQGFCCCRPCPCGIVAEHEACGSTQAVVNPGSGSASFIRLEGCGVDRQWLIWIARSYDPLLSAENQLGGAPPDHVRRRVCPRPRNDLRHHGGIRNT